MHCGDLNGKEVQKGGTYVHLSVYIRIYIRTCIHIADSLCCAVGTNLEKAVAPTPVFMPGESQGRGSQVGCCLWGHTESDTTDAT